MKTQIVLAFWLAASGYAWAADSSTATSENPAAPAGWSTGQAPVATSTPGAVPPKASPNDPLPPPPSPQFNQALEAVAPLTSEEIRNLRGKTTENDKAIIAPTQTVVPRISALTIDLSPGASLPLVRTAVNYPSSLSFIDSTGAPWKLGAAPFTGSPNFTTFWIPNSPVMVIYANKPYVSANVTVYLEGLSVPVVLTVTSGEPDSKATVWTVDSRLDARIPRRGPAALASAAPERRIGLHDNILQAFLDGVPPKEARRLKATGSVPETTVWQFGDDLYVRSRADLRDEFEATLSSADGTHLWRLPLTPYLSFSVMGRTTALNIALE